MDKAEINKLKEEKVNYDTNGFCVVKNFISSSTRDKLLLTLNKIIDYLIDKGDEGSYINFANKDKKLVNSIHRLQELKDKDLLSIINENNFKELAELLTNSKCTLFSIQAFLKPPGLGLKTPAHQDNAYWCHDGNGGLTLWLSLDKAGEFNSMMKYALNSSKDLVEHITSSNTPGSSLIIPESKLKDYEWHQPELSPGDIAIHNGLVVHFSEKNISNYPRRGFLLNYRPNNCKQDMEKYNNYLKTLETIYDRT
tara:strand:- start:279 stop:1037 length:759 start_codon:yes stop_codon:yes gene_type:complete